MVCLTEETTETLYLPGEQRRIVGISGCALRPPEARKEKPKVATFGSAKIDKILTLEPDLVLGFSDLQAVIAAGLVRHGISLTVFKQRSVGEILDMILLLGAMVGARPRVEQLIADLEAQISAVRSRTACLPRRSRVNFEQWGEPMISGMPWVSELIAIAGGKDCFPEIAQARGAKSRIIADPGEVVRRQPEIIIGSWCGGRFNAERVSARPGWNAIAAVAAGQLHEIESADILQPGPAALSDGLDRLQTIIGVWAGQAFVEGNGA